MILVCKHLIFNIYLFGVLYRSQNCTDCIKTGSFVGRGNQYIQLVKVKLPTISEQLPTELLLSGSNNLSINQNLIIIDAVYLFLNKSRRLLND